MEQLRVPRSGSLESRRGGTPGPKALWSLPLGSQRLTEGITRVRGIGDGCGKLGPRSCEAGELATPRQCPCLMNMHEPPPSLRDVTGRPGVSAGAAPGPRQ